MTWEAWFQKRPGDPGETAWSLVPKGIRIAPLSFASYGRILHQVSLEQNDTTGKTVSENQCVSNSSRVCSGQVSHMDSNSGEVKNCVAWNEGQEASSRRQQQWSYQVGKGLNFILCATEAIMVLSG